ncbi:MULTISPECIES: hypothetical protein [Nonomuraea]|uniref:Uncharacterized protein n=2 Tax=Nonomuraea TaxID=83681 RepID=A0ABW1C0Z6_9ACTN|nr:MULTISPECIES: hypothetical protein [Nonomuraea]MDA0644983.1 hypothetical protein [Nonomuraea ferruginea]
MNDSYATAGAKQRVVIEVAEEHLGTVDDVRAALRRHIDDIADERLACARGIQILLMC